MIVMNNLFAALLAFPAIALAGQFTLERTGTETWRAEYCLDEAVDALKFERPIDGLRENWTVEDDFELSIDAEGAAALRRADGNTFQCAAIGMHTWTGRPEKDYYPFSPFSDGGVSVYTGHLVPSVYDGGEWQSLELPASYVARDGEGIITREPSRLAEQFVYFGRQPVEKSDNLIAVIDPAMPTDARSMILDTVPVVNHMLEETFDFRPASPYMIFMATVLDAFDGHSVKGGALPDQILFTLKGRGIVPLIKQHPTHFPKSTAHEVLHLWQAEHWFGELGSDRPWIHEGSADALAFEIMRMTEHWSEEKYLEVWQNTETECLSALAETSIHAAPDQGRFDVVYSCGALVNRIVGEALNPVDPGEGIIRFWQAMAEWPEDERRMPSEMLYFATLAKLGFSAEQRKALRNFLEMNTDDAETELSRLRRTLARLAA